MNLKAQMSINQRKLLSLKIFDDLPGTIAIDVALTSTIVWLPRSNSFNLGFIANNKSFAAGRWSVCFQIYIVDAQFLNQQQNNLCKFVQRDNLY